MSQHFILPSPKMRSTKTTYLLLLYDTLCSKVSKDAWTESRIVAEFALNRLKCKTAMQQCLKGGGCKFLFGIAGTITIVIV
jgi:hypothetical protein